MHASNAQRDAMISPITGMPTGLLTRGLNLSKLITTPLSNNCGMMSTGMSMYIVTAELNDADIFKPSMLAKHEQLNKINQYLISVMGISNTKFPTSMNNNVCTAEMANITATFDTR